MPTDRPFLRFERDPNNGAGLWAVFLGDRPIHHFRPDQNVTNYMEDIQRNLDSYNPDVFTDQEVRSLNAYQRSGNMHPFTCGGNRTDSNHLDGEGVLIATHKGWICCYCDYTQNWAHDFMKNWSWKV
jgi:hypothetical protein